MTNPNTGEFYIGMRTSKLKPSEDPYRGSSVVWYRNLTEEEIKNVLIKEILCDSYNSVKEMAEDEIRYIRKNINNPLCKNAHIPNSGFYCKEVSIETREKISIGLKGNKNAINNNPWNKGKNLTVEHKNKIKNSMLLSMSEETKIKISEGLKGKEPWNKGKSLSEDHRKNIAKSMKDGMTDEIKQKISKGLKGNIPWNKGKKTVRRTKKQIEEDNLKKQNNA
jgi:hypothetical protein